MESKDQTETIKSRERKEYLFMIENNRYIIILFHERVIEYSCYLLSTYHVLGINEFGQHICN